MGELKWDPVLLAGIVGAVRKVAKPQPKNGELDLWRPVALVWCHLHDLEWDERWPDRLRNRHRRIEKPEIRPLTPEQQALVDQVMNEGSLPVRTSVAPPQESPQAPDPVEDALRDMAWGAGLPVGQAPSLTDAAPEDDEAPVTAEMLRNLWEALVSTQDAMNAMDTTQPVVEITIDTDRPWGGVFFSDQHVLGMGVDHKALEEDLRCWDSHREYLGVFDLGDNLDQFLPTKHPSAMMETLARPGVQRAMVRYLWQRYLAKGLLKAKARGNHDAWSSAADYDFAAELAQEMGVPFLGDGGRVWLHVGKQTYKLELRHDFPYKSSLNTTNSQRRLFEFALGADVVAFGHLHYPDLHFAWRNGHNVALLRCSTYKSADSYAQSKGLQLGYAPPPPDMPMVIFWPDQHRILPFRNYRDGLLVLEVLRKQ